MFKYILLSFILISSIASANTIPKLPPAESIKVTPSKISENYPKSTPILLLSCVDYRFQDEVMDFMIKRGALDKYDNIVIAGASLGVDHVLHPELKKSFMTQLRMLKKMHDLKMVILLDHRDCEFFKTVHTSKHTQNRDDETKLHSYHLHNVRKLILSEYPDMVVEMLLMDTDGSVETINK